MAKYRTNMLYSEYLKENGLKDSPQAEAQFKIDASKSAGAKVSPEVQQQAETHLPGTMPSDAEILKAIGGGDLKDPAVKARFDVAKANYAKNLKNKSDRKNLIEGASEIAGVVTNPLLAGAKWLYQQAFPNEKNVPAVLDAVGNPVGTVLKTATQEKPMDTSGNVNPDPKALKQEIAKPGTGTPISFEEYAKANKYQDLSDPKVQDKYREYVDLFRTTGSNTPVVSKAASTPVEQPVDKFEPATPDDLTDYSKFQKVQADEHVGREPVNIWDAIMGAINSKEGQGIIDVLQNAVEHRTASLQGRRVDFDKDTNIGMKRVQKLKEDEINKQFEWQKQLQELDQDFRARQQAAQMEYQKDLESAKSDNDRALAQANYEQRLKEIRLQGQQNLELEKTRAELNKTAGGASANPLNLNKGGMK